MKVNNRTYKITQLSRKLSFILGTAFVLSSCSGIKTTPVKEPEGPVSVITGKTGGTNVLDLNLKKDQSGQTMPVNALLWRAALDIASFVPLDDVDTFGGSIVTEWYQPKTRADQRMKLTMFVVGSELRSDAITVRVYIQNQLGTEWVDAGRDEALGRKLEDLVLTRARELRAAATAKTAN